MLLLVLAGSPALGEEVPRAVASTTVAPGLTHEVWALPDSTARVHVARRTADSPVRMQLVQAHDAVADGPETTSSMCRRTRGCRLAVNGDFFGADGPLGAVVVGGRMLRSPRPDHEQVSLEPLRSTVRGLGDGGWAGAVERPGGRDPLRLDGLNVPLRPGGLVLYTSRYGAATPPCVCAEVRLAEEQVPAGRLDRPAAVTVTGHGSGRGGTPLPDGIAVLAGQGAAAGAVAALTGRLALSVSVAQPTRDNLGAHPVLLRDGQPQPYDQADPMLADPHPRTIVGWDRQGTVWLVTADGRRPGGAGLTARQSVAFLQQLGASDAAMLDGGGSAAFVARGRVVNAPSDGVERPVANAIAMVWLPAAAALRTPAPTPAGAPAAAGTALVPVPVPSTGSFTSTGLPTEPSSAPPSPRPAVPPAPAPALEPAPAGTQPAAPASPTAAAAGPVTVVRSPTASRSASPPSGAVAAPDLAGAPAAAVSDPERRGADPLPLALLAALACAVAALCWVRAVTRPARGAPGRTCPDRGADGDLTGPRAAGR